MTVSKLRKQRISACLGLWLICAACGTTAPSRSPSPVAPAPAAAPAPASPPAPSPAPSPSPDAPTSGERVLSLGAAEAAELVGAAFVRTGKEARRPLQKGERLASGQRIETGDAEDTRLELRFGDGSLLRLGKGAAITLLTASRQVALHRGRLLVDGDRMLGSIAVLTRFRSFVPEGTTYTVELDVNVPTAPRLELVVLDGAVCACPVTDPDGRSDVRPRPTKNWIVVHGEKLDVRPAGGIGDPTPQPDALTDRLRDDALLTRFARRLPSWRRIDDLADQQRRGFLLSRNERLRREIFWKRPVRPPIKLPAPFSDPDSVTVKYEYPL
jgi:hypothetical protein